MEISFPSSLEHHPVLFPLIRLPTTPPHNCFLYRDHDRFSSMALSSLCVVIPVMTMSIEMTKHYKYANCKTIVSTCMFISAVTKQPTSVLYNSASDYNISEARDAT